MEEHDENGVNYVLPDGFEPEDLEAGGYAAPMREVYAGFTADHEYLAERAKMRDFNPVRELDYTANGCGERIDAYFETAARYAEGRVPQAGFSEMMETFHAMMAQFASRMGAPIAELDAAGVAFREVMLLLKKRCPHPEMMRRIYLKKLFAGRDAFKGTLKLLHGAYVRLANPTPGVPAQAAGRRRKSKKAGLTPEQRQRRADRRRVIVEIARLHKKGYSAPGAIRHMRRLGSWEARMRGVTDISWLRYYREYCSAAAPLHG